MHMILYEEHDTVEPGYGTALALYGIQNTTSLNGMHSRGRVRSDARSRAGATPLNRLPQV